MSGASATDGERQLDRSDDVRAAIVAEAMRWIGTPYHHAANVRGAGVDCAMLLVEVYKAVGLAPVDFDPRPYSMQWFLHRDDERYLGFIGLHATRVVEPEIGDVLMYRFGRSASHGAILVEPGYIVHAYRESGKVERVEARAMAARFDSAWTVIR